MEDIVEELEKQLPCRSCSWNKNCIDPPAMTKEEVDGKIKSMLDKKVEEESKGGGLVGGMLATLMLAGKDVECIGCPIFIIRLRQSPKLALEIRKLMQDWKED